MDAGWAEGIARTVSQMVTHPFEQKKIQLQVGGGGGCGGMSRAWRGLFQTSVASGVVYTCYFSIYRCVGEDNPLASTVAALANSLIKTPVHNTMRFFFASPQIKHLWAGAVHMYRQNGLRGMYSGYRVHILEDIIETNIRDFMYSRNKIQKPLHVFQWQVPVDIYNGVIGAVAGSLAAAATTPFDVVKSNLVYRCGKCNLLDVVRGLDGQLFRGVGYRFGNNLTRYFVFYYVVQFLQR